MATLAHSPYPPLTQRQLRRPEALGRLVTLWRFLNEVLAEAQAMRRDAHRKYPFMDS